MEAKMLSRIERELVLQYLRDENAPLTVSLEEKPKASDSTIVENKIDEIENEKVATSLMFPVAVPNDTMTVLEQGIILLRNPARDIRSFLGKKVKVQFYFNHLGLFFSTVVKEFSQGLALVVPPEIFRVEETVTTIDWSIQGCITYSVNNSEIDISCIPENGFQLFQEPKWGLVVNQTKAKGYLEQFVQEAKSDMGNSIGNGMHLISVARYLADVATEEMQDTGRIKPFSIIFMDDRRIVLGAMGKETQLELEDDYKLSLTFTLVKNSMLKRKVNCNVFVENLYENDTRSGTCYVCSYTDLKQEDRRYLFERYYGKKVE